MKPQALIIQAHGTNRDYDVAEALSLAGADPRPVPLNDLRAGKKHFAGYQLLVVAGGFS
ncbi:MAG: phosphoribosylformylglycinamidine synthetase, partial [Chloroflexota bacterium]